jgi:hypothetical protein
VETKDKFLAALFAASPKIPSEWMSRRRDDTVLAKAPAGQ